jgi:hypothetical protein
VLFTIDPRRGERCWFEDYFPAIQRRMFDVFRPVEELVSIFTPDPGTQAAVSGFPLPADLSDLNMHAGWNRPEIYLDETIRRGMSGFALASREEGEAGLDRLRTDLATGAWNERYGAQRTRQSCDLGFVFLKSRRSSDPQPGRGPHRTTATLVAEQTMTIFKGTDGAIQTAERAAALLAAAQKTDACTKWFMTRGSSRKAEDIRRSSRITLGCPVPSRSRLCSASGSRVSRRRSSDAS